jgi:hypothetical protein
VGKRFPRENRASCHEPGDAYSTNNVFRSGSWLTSSRSLLFANISVFPKISEKHRSPGYKQTGSSSRREFSSADARLRRGEKLRPYYFQKNHILLGLRHQFFQNGWICGFSNDPAALQTFSKTKKSLIIFY